MLPTEQALRVYWKGEKVDGVLLYGLRHPGSGSEPALDGLWPDPFDYDEPWSLHGPGWEVVNWTIRTSSWPHPNQWRETLRRTLEALIAVGYVVAWVAVEGDFVDPPDLFDPRYMGHGVYAALSSETGFVSDAMWSEQLRTLNETQLLRLREVAMSVWSPR